jgi:selenide,water dikinase
MTTPDTPDTPFRLTALAHGGGCGCKLSPSVLRELLADMPGQGLLGAGAFPDLLVGLETGDDAAVYRINDHQALVATTDFFMPVVDDPYDFGRIAAANALSDVYAMGGKPLLALAILGMPLGKIPHDVVRQILAGGASIAAEAGIPIAGGHSIDSPEPIYGLAVIGLVDPAKLRRNSDAQPGDILILTKPLGVGILSAALKTDRLPPAEAAKAYAALIATTTQLNAVGADLAALPQVHAITDVTGFGLAGHGLEMARGSALAAHIRFADLPLLPTVAALAQAGVRTGAATRNWASYGDEVHLAPASPEWHRDLITDPQTSGGLLLSVAPEAVPEILTLLHQRGFTRAAAIGHIAEGPPQLHIT